MVSKTLSDELCSRSGHASFDDVLDPVMPASFDDVLDPVMPVWMMFYIRSCQFG